MPEYLLTPVLLLLKECFTKTISGDIRHMNKNLSTILILAAGSLWGMMGLFVRGLSAEGLGTIEIVFFRSVIAALFMFVCLIIKDREKLKIRVKDIWCFVGTGIISLTVFNICYFTTIQKTSMAVAAILLYTSPVFVVLLSAVLFKEKLTSVKVIALVVAFVGCVFVAGITSGDGLVMNPGGIAVGIGAGIGYALYSIFGRYAIERGYGSTTITFYTFAFASLGMLLASPILCPIPEIAKKIAAGNTAKDIALICGIAIIVSVIPYLLYTKGLEGVENGKAGIMASVEPVVAAILGIIVYKEALSISTLLGVIFVLGAIVLLNAPASGNKKGEGDGR